MRAAVDGMEEAAHDGREVGDARDALAHDELERNRRQKQRVAQLEPVRDRRDRRRVHHKRQTCDQ